MIPVPREKPELSCDIVMKGGITSGVVYPLAVTELATVFRLRNIGGTSAGAIAAAAAAAAEHGRRSGGFERLGALPEWLGSPAPGTERTRSNLFSLFQPQPGTRALFEVATAWFAAERWRAVWVLVTAVRHAFLPALFGALLGVVFARFATPFVTVLLAALGALFGTLAWLLVEIATKLPANLYGLCDGRTSGPPHGPPALTDWLHRYLNELAGKEPDGPPLTFGELWWPHLPAGTDGKAEPPALRLQVMTTSVSHGRPYQLPFGDELVHENRFFAFHPGDFRRLFPAAVVDWMEAHAGTTEWPGKFPDSGLRPMPDPWNLPVVVATRMSLSFPVLLSMVPLWAVDHSREDPKRRVPERSWFTDGGLCSNFPVHFFDSPLPRWPTFAINLEPVHIDRLPEARLAPDNRTLIEEHWSRFDHLAGGRGLFALAGAMWGTVQSWTDLRLANQPGQRDRIATVTLADGEGGPNLNMSAQLIQQLAERGRDAGRQLVARFGRPEGPEPMNWSNHRWIRLRAFLAAHEELVARLRTACANPQDGDVPYLDWIRSGRVPENHTWASDGQRRDAEDALAALVAAQASHDPDPDGLARRAPSPRPELRMRPRS